MVKLDPAVQVIIMYHLSLGAQEMIVSKCIFNTMFTGPFGVFFPFCAYISLCINHSYGYS